MFVRLQLILIVLCALPSTAHAQGIQFRNLTLSQALQAARAEQKQVFVAVVDGWNVPCRKGIKRALASKEVGAFANAHFVSLRLEMFSPEGQRVLASTKSWGNCMLVFNHDSTLEHQAYLSSKVVKYTPFFQEAKSQQGSLRWWKALPNPTALSHDSLFQYLSVLAEASQTDSIALAQYYHQIGWERVFHLKNIYLNIVQRYSLEDEFGIQLLAQRKRLGLKRYHDALDTAGIDEVLFHVINNTVRKASFTHNRGMFLRAFHLYDSLCATRGSKMAHFHVGYASTYLYHNPRDTVVFHAVARSLKGVPRQSKEEKINWLDCMVLAGWPVKHWDTYPDLIARKHRHDLDGYDAEVLALAYARLGNLPKSQYWLGESKTYFKQAGIPCPRLGKIEQEMQGYKTASH
jgi:hypothetical protein